MHGGVTGQRSAGGAVVVVATPHGGRGLEATLSSRTTGYLEGDEDTDILAATLHRELVVKSETAEAADANVEVLTIVAKLARRYCDLNRPRGPAAFQSHLLEAYYDHYHGSIRSALETRPAAARMRILVDLHGQSSRKSAVLYRTRCHHSSPLHLLLERELVARLTAAGISLLSLDADLSVGRHFHGHTVDTHCGPHVFAVQLEVGKHFRHSPEAIRSFAASLSSALCGALQFVLIGTPEKAD